MKNICCCIGDHRHSERHRTEVKRSDGWGLIDNRTGEKIIGSEFSKVHYVIIKECERNKCNDRIAYYIVVNEGGHDNGKITEKRRIHLDMANELTFAEKI